MGFVKKMNTKPFQRIYLTPLIVILRAGPNLSPNLSPIFPDFGWDTDGHELFGIFRRHTLPGIEYSVPENLIYFGNLLTQPDSERRAI